MYDAMVADQTLASSSSDPSTAPRPSTSAPATVLAGTHQGHTHMVNGQGKGGDSLPNLGDMDARCGGCQKVIDQESGGVVVAFGYVVHRSRRVG